MLKGLMKNLRQQRISACCCEDTMRVCLEDIQDSEHYKIKGIINLIKTPKASMGFYHLHGGCRGDLAYSFKSLPAEN